MSFDPLDHTTWYDDPEDFIVPPHKDAHITATMQYTCIDHADEEAQVRAFLGLDKMDISEEQKAEAMRQVMDSRQAIHDALKSLQDAEEAMNMTDDDVANEMRRRAGWDQEEAEE